MPGRELLGQGTARDFYVQDGFFGRANGGAGMARDVKFSIQDDVPLPTPRGTSNGGNAVDYRLAEFEVGDSAWYSKADYPKAVARCRVRAARLGVTIAFRKQSRDGEEGVRIWRTA